MIVRPAPETTVEGPDVAVEGWAWSCDGIVQVYIIVDDSSELPESSVADRIDFSWQKFRTEVKLAKGRHTVFARATGADKRQQPLEVGRNHVHRVTFDVV